MSVVVALLILIVVAAWFIRALWEEDVLKGWAVFNQLVRETVIRVMLIPCYVQDRLGQRRARRAATRPFTGRRGRRLQIDLVPQTVDEYCEYQYEVKQ